jgi:hypothetical protein
VLPGAALFISHALRSSSASAPSSLLLAASLALPSALLAPVAARLLEVCAGLGGRADASLGGAPPAAPDALVAAIVGAAAAAATSYVLPFIVTREAALRAAMGTCVLALALSLGAAAAATSRAPDGAGGFDAAHPRPMLLVHVLNVSAAAAGAEDSEASRIVLASLAPGPLPPLAAALAASFRGAAGARGRGASAAVTCHDATRNADDAVLYAAHAAAPQLVTAHATAWCDIRVAHSMAQQALAAAGGRAPALTFAPLAPAAVAHAPRRRVVRIDAGGATRWALSVNPDAVERYALAAGWHDEPAGGEESEIGDDADARPAAALRAPPAWGAPGAPPLGWTPARRSPGGGGGFTSGGASTSGRWPALRHAGGASATHAFTLWLDLRPSYVATRNGTAQEGEQTPLLLARLRADYTAETPAWGAAAAALPPHAALFGKATLPQALALVADLRDG